MILFVNQPTLRDIGIERNTASETMTMMRKSIHCRSIPWIIYKYGKHGDLQQHVRSVASVETPYALKVLRKMVDSPYSSRVNTEKWNSVIEAIIDHSNAQNEAA